jgi:2-succinyl-6-hydroxy-2,4-cyclohexadiene-1-carboxylate synthase
MARQLGRRYPLPGYWAELFGSAGEPRCLLLHGFTGTGADWANWRPDMPSALAIDLPGHGGSPQPAGDFGSEITRLLAALPATIDCLIGYSLGGRIGLSLLAAAPARFRSAIILSAHPGLVDAAHRSARRTADRQWIELLRGRGIVAFTAAWEQQPLFATQRRLPAARLEGQYARRLAQDAEGLARALEIFGLAEMPATWDAVVRWRGRLDWIVGSEDAKFLGIAEQVLTQRAAGRLHSLPGIGHNPLIEAPEQLFALLRRLLAETPEAHGDRINR